MLSTHQVETCSLTGDREGHPLDILVRLGRSCVTCCQGGLRCSSCGTEHTLLTFSARGPVDHCGPRFWQEFAILQFFQLRFHEVGAWGFSSAQFPVHRFVGRAISRCCGAGRVFGRPCALWMVFSSWRTT